MITYVGTALPLKVSFITSISTLPFQHVAHFTSSVSGLPLSSERAVMKVW